MKIYLKILIASLLILISFNSFSFAAETDSLKTTTVKVTEKIPWMTCTPVKIEGKSNDDINTRTYECTVKSGFQSFMDILQWLVKYFLFIAVLVVVLMLALSWIKMSIAGKNEAAKKQFTHLIEAILLIFLMWFILNSIAPWVYK